MGHEADRRETMGRSLASAVAELEKSNEDLKAQACRMARKTLSPLVAALIAKNEIEGEQLDPADAEKSTRGIER